MNATLWHSGNLELPLDEDPKWLQRRRDSVTEWARQQRDSMLADSSKAVSSLEVHTSALDTEIFDTLFEVMMTRLHHYLSYTSGLVFPVARDIRTLYEDDRKRFRSGPHEGRGNLSDCCWRCTDTGFGIFGAIFAYPHDLFMNNMLGSGLVFPDELGAPGEC